MSSAMTAQLLVKKSCVNLCSLCCSCCSIANYSVIKPKDHWVFFQLLCFNIFLPFYYKEYLLKKSGEVCKSTKDFNPILSSHKRKPQQLKTPKYFWPHGRGGRGGGWARGVRCPLNGTRQSQSEDARGTCTHKHPLLILLVLLMRCSHPQAQSRWGSDGEPSERWGRREGKSCLKSLD